MSNIFENIHFAMQTGRVFVVIAVALLAVWALVSVSAKLLGVVLAAAGLATLLWFPGIPEHQPAAFRSAMTKFAVLLVAAGLLLIIFG